MSQQNVWAYPSNYNTNTFNSSTNDDSNHGYNNKTTTTKTTTTTNNNNNIPQYQYSSRNPPYQVDYRSTSTGKHVSATKRHVRWSFGFSNLSALRDGQTGPECRGREHIIDLKWSVASGKRFIYVDGVQVHYSVGGFTGKFEHGWILGSGSYGKVGGRGGGGGGHILKIVAYMTTPLVPPHDPFHQFDLLLDGRSFFDFPPIYELGVSERGGGGYDYSTYDRSTTGYTNYKLDDTYSSTKPAPTNSAAPAPVSAPVSAPAPAPTRTAPVPAPTPAPTRTAPATSSCPTFDPSKPPSITDILNTPNPTPPMRPNAPPTYIHASSQQSVSSNISYNTTKPTANNNNNVYHPSSYYQQHQHQPQQQQQQQRQAYQQPTSGYHQQSYPPPPPSSSNPFYSPPPPPPPPSSQPSPTSAYHPYHPPPPPPPPSSMSVNSSFTTTSNTQAPMFNPSKPPSWNDIMKEPMRDGSFVGTTQQQQQQTQYY